MKLIKYILFISFLTTPSFSDNDTLFDEWKRNLDVAVENNIYKFDTSLFGIGGCPAVYQKGEKKTGNLNIFHAVRYLSSIGCDLDDYILSQDWEEELFKIENEWKHKLV